MHIEKIFFSENSSGKMTKVKQLFHTLKDKSRDKSGKNVSMEDLCFCLFGKQLKLYLRSLFALLFLLLKIKAKEIVTKMRASPKNVLCINKANIMKELRYVFSCEPSQIVHFIL